MRKKSLQSNKSYTFFHEPLNTSMTFTTYQICEFIYKMFDAGLLGKNESDGNIKSSEGYMDTSVEYSVDYDENTFHIKSLKRSYYNNGSWRYDIMTVPQSVREIPGMDVDMMIILWDEEEFYATFDFSYDVSEGYYNPGSYYDPPEWGAPEVNSFDLDVITINSSTHFADENAIKIHKGDVPQTLWTVLEDMVYEYVDEQITSQ